MENYPATIPTVACCTAVFGPGRDGPNEEEVEGQGSYLAVYKASTNSTTMMVLPVTARASSMKYLSIFLSESWIQLLLRCVQNWSEETSSSEDAGRCQDGDQRETLGADTGRHLMMRPVKVKNEHSFGYAIQNRPSRKPNARHHRHTKSKDRMMLLYWYYITITTMKNLERR